MAELYLAKTLKDPSSFQMDDRCDVTAGKTAWIVTCQYRARNSFGGLTMNRNRFHIKDGSLIKVE